MTISIDAQDVINTSLGQLTAMLALIYGEGFDSFDGMNDDLKQWYFSAMFDLADKAKKAIEGSAT
jgi:hypothetical protein